MKMQKAVDVFGQWAKQGKDKGMEKGHAAAVKEMLNFAYHERYELGEKFSFLDLGCGNGWVVRQVAENGLCKRAVGVDGAQQMIFNAESRDSKNEYIHADIDAYRPFEKFDVIHSMEVLYYLKKPSEIVKEIYKHWLNPNGRLIVGIDHYYENFESHCWETKVGTPMLLIKESDWKIIFEESGLSEVTTWRSNKTEEWSGTLVITGKKI